MQCLSMNFAASSKQDCEQSRLRHYGATAGGWLKRIELQEVPELAAFAKYKGELAGGPERNNGAAAVLAWVSVNGGIAIIDEIVGRTIRDP